jgi:hypothetical protein
MTRAMLNFVHTGCTWAVHFVEADGWTPNRPRPRFHDFPTVEHLRFFVARCHPEEGELEYFEHCVKTCGPGQRIRYAGASGVLRMGHRSHDGELMPDRGLEVPARVVLLRLLSLSLARLTLSDMRISSPVCLMDTTGRVVYCL